MTRPMANDDQARVETGCRMPLMALAGSAFGMLVSALALVAQLDRGGSGDFGALGDAMRGLLCFLPVGAVAGAVLGLAIGIWLDRRR